MKQPVPTSADSSQDHLTIWCVSTLGLASLLAWFPTLRTTIPVAEDHVFIHYYKDGYFDGLSAAFDFQGVWRIIGFSIVGFSANLHPLAYPVVALLTHAATVCVFFFVSSHLLGSRRTALGLGLVLAILPLGYQALTWAVCYPFILASLLFWTQMWVLVEYGDRLDCQRAVFAALTTLTLLGALSNECLLGASLATCSWFWLRERPSSLRSIWDNMKTYYAGSAPLAGAALYVAGYYGFRPEVSVKQPGLFNPRSLASAYYHTTKALAVFGAWASPVMRDLGFDSWTTGATILAIALATLLAFLVVYVLRLLPEHCESRPNSFRAGTTVASLLFGTSLIYAISGGFSPESRKLYPICFVMALAAGFLLIQLSLEWIVRPTVVLLVVACCVPTSWLLTGVWRFEAARHHSLARTLAENDIHARIEVRSDADPYVDWPYLFASYGFRVYDDWVLDYTLAFDFPRHGGGLDDEPPENRAVLRYDRLTGWSVVSDARSPVR